MLINNPTSPSFFDTLDPRTRVILTHLFALPSALTQSLTGAGIACLFACLFAFAARLSVAHIKSRLWTLMGFLTLLWATVPLTMPGQTLWAWRTIYITHEGLQFAQLLSLRMIALVIGTTALLHSLSPFELAHALRHLHVPQKLVVMLFFCVRYIDVIHNEYQRLHRAMRVRGFVPRTTRHTYKSYAHLLGMLLVRSFERAERIYHAMRMRGFVGVFPIYRTLTFQSRDVVCTGSAMLTVGVCFWIV